MKTKSERSFLEILLESVATGVTCALDPNFGYYRDMGAHAHIIMMHGVNFKDRVYHLAHYLSAELTRPIYYLSGKNMRDNRNN